MKIFEELKWRGLVKDVAGEDIADKLNNESITFYWGTDPTADSLHLGHYSSLLMAKRLLKAGHKPLLLCGGATGLIGDPRPTAERDIISKETLNSNLLCIQKQVKEVVGSGVETVNNYDWFKDYSFIEVLRDVGKYINVNYMLDKDIIKRRLDSGITFAEFAYTLIQGYDFLHLYQEKNCVMQVCGSDQWGNVTTGLELIRKKLGTDAYAFTMPLILDKNGNKFGKSEGNALWLDKSKTSSYEMYQYLLNVDDSMVIHYLKIFTFLSKEEIDLIEKKHLENPHLREAHKILAKEIICDIHGTSGYEEAIKVTDALFSGNIKELSKEEISIAFKGIDTVELEDNINIIDALVLVGACSSKREAREFVSNNSISINGDKINDLDYVVSKDNALHDKYIIVRRGKKKYYIGIIK